MSRFWNFSAIFVMALLTACGGTGGTSDSPRTSEPAAILGISSASAQAVSVTEVAHLHAVLRPDSNGRWFIQNDVDHVPIGFQMYVEQDETNLYVYFDRNYTHAGVIQITSDDDFGLAHVSGHSNLATNKARIVILVNGQPINPATIYDHMPQGGGNFWISVTMINRR